MIRYDLWKSLHLFLRNIDFVMKGLEFVGHDSWPMNFWQFFHMKIFEKFQACVEFRTNVSAVTVLSPF